LVCLNKGKKTTLDGFADGPNGLSGPAGKSTIKDTEELYENRIFVAVEDHCMLTETMACSPHQRRVLFAPEWTTSRAYQYNCFVFAKVDSVGVHHPE